MGLAHPNKIGATLSEAVRLHTTLAEAEQTWTDATGRLADRCLELGLELTDLSLCVWV